MGTRGSGGVAAGLVGSVAQATVAQCGVPVLLVK
jgi:nucleotide-binding universal stress UspA family protein